MEEEEWDEEGGSEEEEWEEEEWQKPRLNLHPFIFILFKQFLNPEEQLRLIKL